MTTLAEKNRIYQQRHRAKVRETKGIEALRQENSTYMKQYRAEKRIQEGYVPPKPVQAPVQVQKEIIIKKTTKTKNTKKEDAFVNGNKLKLASTSLSDKSIKGYVQTIDFIHRLITKEQFGSKQEIIKALKGQKYNTQVLKSKLSYYQIDKLQETINIIRKYYIIDNAYKTNINGIVSVLGRIEGFDKAYEVLGNINSKLQVEYTKKRDLNEVSAEELEIIKKIKFDDESIANGIKKIKKLEDKVLYALYMYIPRRLEMRTLRIKYNTNNTDKGNYIIVHNEGIKELSIPHLLIFNEYKTSKHRHKEVVEIPDEIKPLLHEYVLENDFKTNDELLFHINQYFEKEKYDDNDFSVKFQMVFKEVYGVPIKNQTLRVAFASYFNPKAKNVAEKKIIADKLSHDYLTNEQYGKFNVVG